jgi:hypothetical protein
VDVLLVTGAGASRNLGRDDEGLPLMGDWANALCTALDEQLPGLANACGLSTGMAPDKFEEAVGQLLEYGRTQPMIDRYLTFGGPNPGEVHGDVQGWRNRTTQRLDQFERALNVTLYEQFGQGRIDENKAVDAYRQLFETLEVRELAVATTNYDRSGEAALGKLGFTVANGFSQEFGGRVPSLEPSLFEEDGATPYLHLHGAVGWYMGDDGVVRDHGSDQRFFPDFGSPVVLYPDPKKDPINDATVSAIWGQLERMLSEAKRVVVLGHSLHDPALVSAIRRADPAVTYHSESEVDDLRRQLPQALLLRADFGPNLDLEYPRRLPSS